MKEQELLKKMVRNAVLCRLDRTGKHTMGKSKIGGCPDIPADFEWMYPRKPLSFLAQINLGEIKELDDDGLLPESGMLYFFYDIDEMPDFQYGEQAAYVYYYNGDMAELKPAEFPAGLGMEQRIPEFPLFFEKRKELPMYEEFCELTSTELLWDDYLQLVQDMSLQHNDNEETIKLLGYADLVQGSMLSECDAGDSFYDISQNRKWILLLQVDTISNETYELMFYDCGRLYFYIDEKDLEQKNFSRVRYFIQSY